MKLLKTNQKGHKVWNMFKPKQPDFDSENASVFKISNFNLKLNSHNVNLTGVMGINLQTQVEFIFSFDSVLNCSSRKVVFLKGQ